MKAKALQKDAFDYDKENGVRVFKFLVMKNYVNKYIVFRMPFRISERYEFFRISIFHFPFFRISITLIMANSDDTYLI